MSRLGADYAAGRPTAQALRDARFAGYDGGITFVCRYLSPSSTWKNLSRSEAEMLSAGGIDIVSNWEWYANRMREGHGAGVSDARTAHSQSVSFGAHPSRPIYFSADWDATPGEQGGINAYLEGARSVLGPGRVGIYGGYWVISRALDYWAHAHPGETLWAWQTYAWSGGHWDNRVHIRQVKNGVHGAGIGDLDLDTAHSTDFGQWRIGATLPTPQLQEDLMGVFALPRKVNETVEVTLPEGVSKIWLSCDHGTAKYRFWFHRDGQGGWEAATGPLVDVGSDQANGIVTLQSDHTREQQKYSLAAGTGKLTFLLVELDEPAPGAFSASGAFS